MGKKGKFGLAAIFTLAAAYLEITGYNDFNRSDGTNALCDIDPTCRYLTTGEIETAKEVFGNEVNYNTIKIFDRPNLINYPFQLLASFNAIREAPNGNIYYRTHASRKDDVSKHPASIPSFLHEMTHVWQYQSGRKMLFAIMEALWQSKSFDYSETYEYDIDSPELFKNLNIEQQANIIGDFYRLKHKEESKAPADCARLKKLEEKIQEAIPVAPVICPVGLKVSPT